MSYLFEKCQRCQSPEGMAIDVALFGAYHATLCRQHAREWDDSAPGVPEWLEISVIKAQLGAAIASGDTASAARYQREGNVIFLQLYAIAKAWAEAEPTPKEAKNDE